MQDDIELLFEGVADKIGKVIAMTQARLGKRTGGGYDYRSICRRR